MTVQELIDKLNKVEDKSKSIFYWLSDDNIKEVQEDFENVLIY